MTLPFPELPSTLRFSVLRQVSKILCSHVYPLLGFGQLKNKKRFSRKKMRRILQNVRVSLCTVFPFVVSVTCHQLCFTNTLGKKSCNDQLLRFTLCAILGSVIILTLCCSLFCDEHHSQCLLYPSCICHPSPSHLFAIWVSKKTNCLFRMRILAIHRQF